MLHPYSDMAVSDLANQLGLIGAAVPEAVSVKAPSEVSPSAIRSQGLGPLAEARGFRSSTALDFRPGEGGEDLDKRLGEIEARINLEADKAILEAESTERAQRLSEFSRLNDLRVDNLQRQVSLRTQAIDASLQLLRTTGRVRQQDVANALALVSLKQRLSVGMAEQDLRARIASGQADLDRAMLDVSRISLAESERGLRLKQEYDRAVIATGNTQATAALLAGIGQLGFATAGLGLQLQSISASNALTEPSTASGTSLRSANG